MAQTVLVYVHLTANMASVETETDHVLPVLKDGWVVIAQLVIMHTFYFQIDAKKSRQKIAIKKKKKKILLKANRKKVKKKNKNKQINIAKPRTIILYYSIIISYSSG